MLLRTFVKVVQKYGFGKRNRLEMRIDLLVKQLVYLTVFVY